MKEHLRCLTLAGGLVAAGTAALLPGSAHACVILPRCAPPVRLFPSDAPVPGNMVFFRERERADAGWGPGTSPLEERLRLNPNFVMPMPAKAPLILRTREGKVIPASTRMIGGKQVFAPEEELPGGLELELEYTPVDCPRDGQQGPQIFAFSTSEPAPFETGDGQLAVAFSGQSEPGEPESLVEVRYMPPDFGASQHLIEYHATIDGLEVSVPLYGGPHVTVRTVCQVPDRILEGGCGTYSSFPMGQHEVVVWSSRVGESEQLALARLSVETRPEHCRDEEEAEPVDESEEMASAEPDRDDVPKASEGCALRSSRRPQHGAWQLASACVALTLLRRRARGRWRSPWPRLAG